MPYDLTDLEHNRAGRLSPAQIDLQNRSWRRIRMIGAAIVVFMVGLGVFFRASNQVDGWIGTWVFAAFVALALFWLQSKIQKVQRNGAVAVITGQVQREAEREDGSTSYFLRVGSLRLAMYEADYEQFFDGNTYRVYYLPETGYVVSGEPEQ